MKRIRRPVANAGGNSGVTNLQHGNACVIFPTAINIGRHVQQACCDQFARLQTCTRSVAEMSLWQVYSDAGCRYIRFMVVLVSLCRLQDAGS